MPKKSLKKKSRQKQLMEKILGDAQYKGKHIVVVANNIFTANTGEGASAILRRVRKEYPEATPAVTYIPDADTLILLAEPERFCAKRRFLWW